jgi:hypothetical protein
LRRDTVTRLLKGQFRVCKRDYSFEVGASRDRTISPSSMFNGLILGPLDRGNRDINVAYPQGRPRNTPQVVARPAFCRRVDNLQESSHQLWQSRDFYSG